MSASSSDDVNTTTGGKFNPFLALHVAQHLQHLAAIHLGHVEVKQDQIRHRVRIASSTMSVPKQVINHLNAASDRIHETVDLGMTERALD